MGTCLHIIKAIHHLALICNYCLLLRNVAFQCSMKGQILQLKP